MMLAVLLQIAAPATAVEAERAMATAAKMEGAAAAMRRYAAPDAVVFLPRPVGVAGLTEAAEPALAGERQPTSSVTSCDGNWAVNSGLVTRADGSVGNFTTVWARAGDGRWQWKVSDDAMLKDRPVPGAQFDSRRAACPIAVPAGAFPVIDPAGARSGVGRSRDGTLGYQWSWAADGTHLFRVGIWNGVAWDIIVQRPSPAATEPAARP